MYRSRDGWRVEWSENGRRRTKKFESRDLAKRFEAELELGIADRGSSKKRLMTFREFSEKWLKDYCRLEKAESQWVNDESTLRIHVWPVFGDRPLGGITKGELEEFRIGLKSRVNARNKKPLAPKTLNNIIMLVKRIFVIAVKWEYLPSSPAGGMDPYPIEEQETQYWSPEERDRFFRFGRHIDPDFVDLVLFACHTGLRLGELAGMQRHQVDFEKRKVLVNAIWCTRTKQRLVRTKTKKIGYVPLNDEAMRIIAGRRQLGLTQAVFDFDLFNDPPARIRSICKRISCRPIRFHDMRHTFASNLAEAGVPLFHVQKMMRHKSPASTQRYAHLAEEHLHDAASRLLPPTQGPHSVPEEKSSGWNR